MFSSEQLSARNWATVFRRWLPWLLLGAALVALSFLGDPVVSGWLEGRHPKHLRLAARFISKVGDWPALVIGAVVVGALGAALHRRCWRIVCMMVLAASLAGITANIFRFSTGRARPHADAAQGWHGPPIGKNFRIAKHGINSFPSAHTTTAMGFFATLLILVPKVGIWFLPAPLLVGVSRLYLGVHHFSDVFAGLLLGTAVAIFTCRVLAPRWPDFLRWGSGLPLPHFLMRHKGTRIRFLG